MNPLPISARASSKASTAGGTDARALFGVDDRAFQAWMTPTAAPLALLALSSPLVHVTLPIFPSRAPLTSMVTEPQIFASVYSVSLSPQFSPSSKRNLRQLLAHQWDGA